MTGLRLPVFVSSWQIECCWAPPGVGDVMEWHLVFEEAAGGSPDSSHSRRIVSELDVTARAHGSPLCADRGPYPVRIGRGDLSAFWLAPHLVAGEVRLAGELHEDHHGEVPEDFPATYAIVRGIEVEERQFVEIRPKDWAPVEGAVAYRPVDVSPKWFRHLVPTVTGRMSETGILVDVEITGAQQLAGLR